MTMLDNAVSSIRLGVEDFQAIPADEARALSAIRNLSAGLLLMFKVKLQELSPADSREALLKQHVTTGLDADGNPVWVGKGGQTVDVRTIQERLKNLGVEGIDWTLLEKLTTMRNDVEHYYSKLPASGLAVSVRRSHLPDPSYKGDGVHLKIRGHHHPYRQDCHAPTHLLSQTL